MVYRVVWSADFAYIVGLIASDGNLSKDGRHIDFTSKDLEQIENFRKILKLNNKIGLKYRGKKGVSDKKYFRVQFGNVKLYKFFLRIGLTPSKSKTIGALKIPKQYFIDFLRGCLDDDGYTTSFWDSIYPNSFRLYTGFVSASKIYLDWLYSQIHDLYGLNGYICLSGRKSAYYQLKFSKKASLRLLQKIYYKTNLICLSRKRFKIQLALSIINKQAGVLKWYTG